MTVFQGILNGTVPADVVYQNKHVVAFRDLHPQAPTHVLVIPRVAIAKLSDATPEHAQVLGQLLLATQEVARIEGLTDYRVVINSGAGAGQSVFHLHLHVLGGRPLGWPPG